MHDTISTLKAARALIAPEGAWTQGRYARDAAGQGVLPDAPEAVCFCAFGALERAGDRDGNAYAALRDAFGAHNSVARWNDAAGRTQAEVLAAFDTAIALAEGKGDGA